MPNTWDYLDILEAEAIYILREVAGQFQRPALLFSGGKDSITLVHLTRKAFHPAPFPFPLLHIDTGHNFPETMAFRDDLVKKIGAELIVGYVQDSIDRGSVIEQKGKGASRNALQSVTLLETIEKYELDACIGGARRDEEKARAKERVFSLRDEFGQWNPKNQRPELWNIYNGKLHKGENMRIFPLSNWTELDVWRYILRENIALPSLYFAHQRKCIIRGSQILPYADFICIDETDILAEKNVRFRTVGDMTCTAAIESNARTIEQVIAEIESLTISERGLRMDDKTSETSMEDRKKEGYF
ncbi:MAG: sulfate adenylyltransferase subunit CysD [Raineya sp.]|nr:sulfate adenylyltransferase subunit CysD [Raineya sp.]MDW8295407.1 sulfate adenylyltransferase subunit CysD [Raineya sp.]